MIVKPMYLPLYLIFYQTKILSVKIVFNVKLYLNNLLMIKSTSDGYIDQILRLIVY